MRPRSGIKAIINNNDSSTACEIRRDRRYAELNTHSRPLVPYDAAQLVVEGVGSSGGHGGTAISGVALVNFADKQLER